MVMGKSNMNAVPTRRLNRKKPRLPERRACFCIPEFDNQEAAEHDAQCVYAKAQAVAQRGNAVMALEDEGRGGNVSEHDSHGKGLDEDILHELPVV